MKIISQVLLTGDVSYKSQKHQNNVLPTKICNNFIYNISTISFANSLFISKTFTTRKGEKIQRAICRFLVRENAFGKQFSKSYLEIGHNGS